MGREGENLPLARASRPSAADAGKASGAALGGLLGRSIVVRERKGSALGVPLRADRRGDRAAQKHRADLRTAFSRASAPPLRGRVTCVASSKDQLDDTWLMEQLAALDRGNARTIQHVPDAILHDVFKLAGEDPKVKRVTVAALGSELVTVDDSLCQRIDRGHAKRALECELLEQTMMGHGNLRVAVIGDT